MSLFRTVTKSKEERLFDQFLADVRKNVFSKISLSGTRRQVDEAFVKIFNPFKKAITTRRSIDIGGIKTTARAMGLFGLTKSPVPLDLERDIESFRSFDAIPAAFEATLKQTDLVLLHSRKRNEAESRPRFGRIYVDVVEAEMSLLNNQMELDTEPNLSPPGHSQQFIYADFEITLQWSCLINDDIVNISGRADYAVAYDSPETEPMALNLVIVEAKKYGEAAKGIPQCMGCMGVIHRQRKDAGKANCEVFGFATDGFEFYFMKIDEHSRIACAPLLTWKDDEESLLIYSEFRSIVHHAGMRSPMLSRQITADM